MTETPYMADKAEVARREQDRKNLEEGLEKEPWNDADFKETAQEQEVPPKVAKAAMEEFEKAHEIHESTAEAKAPLVINMQSPPDPKDARCWGPAELHEAMNEEGQY